MDNKASRTRLPDRELPEQDAVPAVLVPAPSKPARKLSARSRQAREQRVARNREQLITSAARVVGAHGYRDASVQRISADAGLAHGTFYLYFASRQALFEEVLPFFGLRMLEHVRQRSAGVTGLFEREEAGVRAVVEYVQQNPWFWRVLIEAEVEAPRAWMRHRVEVSRRYVKFLRRARAAGELANYAEDELPTLAQLLVAGRDYIIRLLNDPPTTGEVLPDAVLGTYRRFIENGLGRGPRSP